jgi:hypothetical protein
MSKKNHRTKRHLKGGNSFGQAFSNLGSSISEGASSLWNKTKKLVGLESSGSGYSSSTGTNYSTPYTSSASSSSSSSNPMYKYGGRKRKNKMKGSKNSKKMRKGGSGYASNSSLTNLASTAAPFSGVTAKAQLVGGRRKRSRRSRY